MTAALVYNGAVRAVYDPNVPAIIELPVSGSFSALRVQGAASGWSNGSGYSIIPAVYTDTPPANSVSTGVNLASWTVSNGTASGPRTWQAVTPPTPTSVAVVSTGTPALNGTYGCAPSDQQNLAAESTYILVNGGFSTGQSSFPWLDASGTPHLFTSTAQFQAFASAIAAYITALELGQSPTTPLTIA